VATIVFSAAVFLMFVLLWLVLPLQRRGRLRQEGVLPPDRPQES
jgi:HAMP domain-containing protein